MVWLASWSCPPHLETGLDPLRPVCLIPWLYKESQWNVIPMLSLEREEPLTVLSPSLFNRSYWKEDLPSSGWHLKMWGLWSLGEMGRSWPLVTLLESNLHLNQSYLRPFQLWKLRNSPMWFKPIWVRFSVTCSVRSSIRYTSWIGAFIF